LALLSPFRPNYCTTAIVLHPDNPSPLRKTLAFDRENLVVCGRRCESVNESACFVELWRDDHLAEHINLAELATAPHRINEAFVDFYSGTVANLIVESKHELALPVNHTPFAAVTDWRETVISPHLDLVSLKPAAARKPEMI
jgi:hypothetical protein